jgi:flagellar hook-associated protein 1 FlgK
MGLLSALSNAVTGLNVNQQNLNVLSQNISNANTPNYSNEVANQQAQYDNGLGTGVSVESITRTVDDFLTAEVQSQTSTNSSASAVQSYYGQIENLLGQPGSTNTIDQGIDSFFTAMQDLANGPSVSTETTAINAGVTAAGQISGLASGLQNLQLQADTDINSSVSSINTDLQTLYSTNASLERAAATNQPTSGLLDQRDAALTDLAQYIDINPAYQLDGEVSVNTSNGITLLDGHNSVSELTYTPATSVQTFAGNGTLSPLQVITLDTNGNPVGKPVTLVTGGTPGNVTTSLTGGKIQGLLQMRDTIIPNIMSQLDQLAGNLRDSVNAISNQGSSFPPPNSYTGTRLTAANAASQWSGSTQIALLDANGNPVPSPYGDEPNGLQPLTLNLAALQGTGANGTVTTNDIVNAINQYYGTPQNKTELGNINNVQLGMLSNDVPDTGNTLNFDFNLNNISSSNADFYVSGVTVLDSTGATVASTALGSVTSTQPSTAIASYQSNAANTVTVTTQGANTFANGETVYLNPGTGLSPFGTATLTAGYYTVNNVTGTSFDITLAGASPGASQSATAASALPPYDTVDSGDTTRTGANGSITVSNIGSSSPYYTVEADIATIDSSGNVVQSTVSYTVPSNTSNVKNNLIGATSQTGSATIVAPTTTQPLITATLVNASGTPLIKTNGSYGTQQGYLQITADNSSYTVAINELSSAQLGLPGGNPPQAGSGEGFSQYFGLNNFFNSNLLTPTGDTVAGSALNLSVENRIVSDPGLISTGTLSQSSQPSGGGPPNFTYLVASGDNSISQQLAALATTDNSFGVAGGMPASSTTFSQYAGQIIAKTSNDSTDATNTASDSQTLLTGFTARAQSVSGVNLDQELANTVIYQNAYSASTRVITVVSNMFDQLLGIIQ